MAHLLIYFYTKLMTLKEVKKTESDGGVDVL